MNETSQIKKFLKAKDKFCLTKDYSDKLKNELNLKPEKIKSIIESVKVANLYSAIKGKREARMIGFSDKKEIKKIIVEKSEEFNWEFKTTKNERSFHIKMKKYQMENQKSEYLGLKSFIYKYNNNENSKK
ncbi:hypothetical protein LNI95_11860 [Tenacibaculum dicentrarchi]|nr:hypothetical protein [Tenacibaculum dicentrarchi]WBX67917.1 hypothetical protein PG910_07205 [Tenacibaculum dicentrarchi]